MKDEQIEQQKLEMKFSKQKAWEQYLEQFCLVKNVVRITDDGNKYMQLVDVVRSPEGMTIYVQ